MHSPLVSVIIPTYNSVQYVVTAVESVLAQAVKDIEIIVVDDGSTDDTQSVMREFGASVRYIRQQNSGVAAARNRGIEESRGRYIAFLDADDTWFPHKLERQLAALDQRPGYSVCYSAFTVVDSDLKPLFINRSKRAGSALEDLLLRGNIVGSICTVLGERKLFETVGGFDTALSQCADWDMWVRLAELTDFLYVDEPLVTYRQHDANMSRNAPLLEHDSVIVLEKGFAAPGLAPALRARRRRAHARNYMVLAGTYFHARLYKDFFRCAVRAVTLDFRQATYLMAFPARLASRLRQDRSAAA
ncbi:MAG TPA: glycosyltransferase [Blastocatellia bacterium]|nr:glycosyltransferase [Blastocatellia bacterium]